MASSKGEETLTQLAPRFGVYPRSFLSGSRRRWTPDRHLHRQSHPAKTHEQEIKEVHADIGRLTVEPDFLAEAFMKR